MSVKRVWQYSEKWGIGVKPQKIRSSNEMTNGAVESVKKGILTLNPFGTKVKMPKLNLPSDEFITYKKPLPSRLSKILKNLK